MINNAIETIKKYNMLSPNDNVLVAVSGGADSMALLTFLYDNKNALNITVCAAHIEHGIRGEESLDDAKFVSDYCKKRNIKLYTKSINAPKEAQKAKMGVEEYSRKARYDFFDTIDCDKIATAHNLTDNVETLIFRLARGTGIKGACAIPPVRDKIIRPFIEISSQEIRAYCKDNNIPYRVDSTNSDTAYSRNLIRNKVLPLLENINSEYQANISSFISDCAEDNLFIENEARRIYNELNHDNTLDSKRLKAYNKATVKRVITMYFSDNNITLDRKHLDEVSAIAEKSGKVQIKGDIFAVCAGGKLRVANLSENGINKDFLTEILNINEFNKKNIDFYCDCDKIIGRIVLRARKSGDFITPSGRNCKKSLKKLYNELAIPLEKRGSNLVVADDKGVIGIIGYCVDERVKLEEGTNKVFTIRLFPED